MKRFLVLMFLGGLLAAATKFAPPSSAMSLSQVISTIQNSGGVYVRAGASLSGADCSGLVSVAQSLAMGQAPHRLGDTHSLLAGRWPNAIPGAQQDDLFIIGVNPAHMVARVNGVNIEATTSGRPFLVGAQAADPFNPRFRQFHIDPAVLMV